jgi:hypothetical protein
MNKVKKTSSTCVADSGAWRVIFARRDQLQDGTWVRDTFAKVCEIITRKEGKGVKAKNVKLPKLGPVLDYSLPVTAEGASLNASAIPVLVQSFEGAILYLKIELENNSLVLCLFHLAEVDCNRLNGELAAIVGDAQIVSCDHSMLYCRS